MKITVALVGGLFLVTSCGIVPHKKDNQISQSAGVADWETYLDRISAIENNPAVKAVTLPFACWPSTEITSLPVNEGVIATPAKFCQIRGEVDYHFDNYAYLGAMDAEASFQRTSRTWDLRNPANYNFRRFHFTFQDANNWKGTLYCSSHEHKPGTSIETRKATFAGNFEMKNGELVNATIENLPYVDPKTLENQKPDIEICNQ